jgi:addiction module HigA family antidote
MAASRMKASAHPGGYVKTEVIEALGLSVTDAAQALGVTRPALSKLLNERAHLSPEMALRIEKAFGVSMDTLMQMQSSFDIAEARKREGDINVLPFKNQKTAPHATQHAKGDG